MWSHSCQLLVIIELAAGAGCSAYLLVCAPSRAEREATQAAN